jgi:trans-AT polyketide synthase/acyltransferase/oxidoreductase domain-containing protein
VLGYSVAELCVNDPEGNLSRTEYTQPAIYAVNALMFYKRMREGKIPDFYLGHSLGEYNALMASGAFDFVTGLKLVKERGRLMSRPQNGGMAAIVGLAEKDVGIILTENNLPEISIANCNSPEQFVVSGPISAIEAGKNIFEKNGAKLYAILNVSGAFHSSYMKQASDEFNQYISAFDLKPPKVPVISNVMALPHEANKIKGMLVKQIYSPVRWTESVRYLFSGGVTEIEEIGPGNVLKGLIRAIKRHGA